MSAGGVLNAGRAVCTMYEHDHEREGAEEENRNVKNTRTTNECSKLMDTQIQMKCEKEKEKVTAVSCKCTETMEKVNPANTNTTTTIARYFLIIYIVAF